MAKANRIPGDKFEAALLVDTYIQIVTGKLPRKEAVSSLSKQLRQRTLNAGILIDDVFRNENGISMRLHEIEYLMTDEESGLKNTSRLFREMVRMYRTDPLAYQSILRDAQKQIEEKEFSEESFIDWLSVKLSPKQFNEMRLAINKADAFGRKIGLLKSPLFDTKDRSLISRLKTSMEQDLMLRLFNKKEQAQMIEACRWYQQYLLHIEVSDLQKKREVQPAPANLQDANAPIVTNAASALDGNKDMTIQKDETSKQNILPSCHTNDEKTNHTQNMPETPTDNLEDENNTIALKADEQRAGQTTAEQKTADSPDHVATGIKSSQEPVEQRDPPAKLHEPIAQAPNNESEQPSFKNAVFSYVIYQFPQSYNHTIPLHFTYFGTHYYVNTWVNMYTQALFCLYEDYPDKIRELAKYYGLRKELIHVGTAAHRYQMVLPEQIAEDLYGTS
ncbi:MAG: hypothetical protein ACOX6Y_06460 [Christensenellales bacterium]